MLVVLSPVLILFFFLAVAEPRTTHSEWEGEHMAATTYTEETPETDAAKPNRKKTSVTNKKATNTSDKDKQELVNYALSLIGSPYVYAGMSENGFDCSGFTTYVFEQSGLEIGRSSSLQADEGHPVNLTEARPGDLLIFTGTDKTDRTPGHVGIVISSPGDTVSFVHSSSNGGVKISQVEGTAYEERFLDVRRVM